MLTISNKHSPECGKPPIIKLSNEKYLAYFENRYGEQFIFVGDKNTKKATLYGGEFGWFPLGLCAERMIPEVLLNEDEQSWLKGCWSAFLYMSMADTQHEWRKQSHAMMSRIATQINEMA